MIKNMLVVLIKEGMRKILLGSKHDGLSNA